MTNLLMRCIEERVGIEMIYLSQKGDISHRIVIPYSFDGHIIKGYCSTKKQIRSFHIRNILSVHSRLSF
ncbi:hypothetical protein ABE65_007100 [Fictibacillus phosphorivorans]|uniref:WYL domain-containing protein n=1 Tax=Fictibacillus phosphorivorans TaxID=1221500 RepID=A0A160IK99_9BACL|nr:hypothetical protein [Fictibacillus phosphorivorans]ANC76578.1 hypothetical protein ABE65_007100 [Fictibacillus phosphorivorans]